MPKKPLELEREIMKDGWYFVSQEGSHKHYKHPIKKGKVTITFHARELSTIVERSVKRQAGLLNKEGR